jgi:hypothetical protein
MRSPCCLFVCVSSLISSFSLRSVSNQRKVGEYFFLELHISTSEYVQYSLNRHYTLKQKTALSLVRELLYNLAYM